MRTTYAQIPFFSPINPSLSFVFDFILTRFPSTDKILETVNQKIDKISLD